MREIFTYGSVRRVGSNPGPYSEPGTFGAGDAGRCARQKET